MLFTTLIMLLLAAMIPAWAARPLGPWAGPPARLIAGQIAGRPIAAGSYLFWFDQRGAIVGYDHLRAREFVLQELGLHPRVASLASDGETVAWIDTRAVPQHIQTYHLPTGRTQTIRPRSAAPMIADIALDHGVLYYWDHAPDHRGIFAYRLADGAERQLSRLPRPTAQGRLAAADGALVWSEYTSQGAGMPPLATLYLYQLANGGKERVIAQGQPWSGAFSGISVGGDHIAWAFELERQVWLATINSGTRQVISIGEASHPVIRGPLVTWNVRFPAQQRYGIGVYDLVGGARAPLIATDQPYAEVQPLGDHDTIAFAVDQGSAAERDLYLASVRTRDLHIPVGTAVEYSSAKPREGGALWARRLQKVLNSFASLRVPSRIGILDRRSGAPAQPGLPAAPPAGQVQVEGSRFVIDGAPGQRWTFNGVHLILPSRGINASSFSAETLADQRATAERSEWLDRARQIGAQTIRIYVDMPGDTNMTTAPRPEQVYWFARDELAPRGMRLALVVHNSGRFDDPGGRKMAWLTSLLDCFGAVPRARAACAPGAERALEDLTHLLVYINADNEINIHRQPPDSAIPGNPACRPDDPSLPQIAEDCFDHPNLDKRRRYMREAFDWVALVRRTVKQHSTGGRVLVTVGMSVDMEKDVLGDGQSAVLNYFTRVPDADGRSGRALVDLVDFLAPHSYTAQPRWEIAEPIERIEPSFDKPILLEEFGYPTDPITQPDPRLPSEYKETSQNIHILADGTIRLVSNPDGLPPGEDINKLCRYLPKLGSFGESVKRCNPSAPFVVQMNLEAIFDTQEFAGGIAFMLADSNEKDDGSMACQSADARRQLSKNLFTGLFATNTIYRCGGTVNVGRGQIKNTGYRVCVAYQTGNPQLGDYQHRVPVCEIDLKPGAGAAGALERALPAIIWIGAAIILAGAGLLGAWYAIRRRG